MEVAQSGDQGQAECEQENGLQQVDETVAPQPGTEQPGNDQTDQPEV